MPRKPDPKKLANRKRSGGQHIAGAKARGLDRYGNPEHMEFASQFEEADAATGLTQRGRYTRTIAALQERFGCHHATAKRAVAAMRTYRMDLLTDRLPSIGADMVDQLIDIAHKAKDRGMPGDYGAAVSAWREIGKIAGVYSPVKVDVTHTGTIEVALQIDAVLTVLDAQDHADLARITGKILAAQAAGQLTEPESDDDDVLDAEIVEN